MIIGLFNLTSGLLLAVTHLVFLNAMIAGSIFENLYLYKKDKKQRRISLLLIVFFCNRLSYLSLLFLGHYSRYLRVHASN